MGVHPAPLIGCDSACIEIDIVSTWKLEEALVTEFDIFYYFEGSNVSTAFLGL